MHSIFTRQYHVNIVLIFGHYIYHEKRWSSHFKIDKLDQKRFYSICQFLNEKLLFGNFDRRKFKFSNPDNRMKHGKFYKLKEFEKCSSLNFKSILFRHVWSSNLCRPSMPYRNKTF